MSWIFTKRNYSFIKLETWSEKGNVDKLLTALKQGNAKSKVHAIKCLEPHNYMHVKRALLEMVTHTNKFVSLRACEIITNMGANLEEQAAIKMALEKHQPQKNTPKNIEDSIYFKIEEVR